MKKRSAKLLRGGQHHEEADSIKTSKSQETVINIHKPTDVNYQTETGLTALIAASQNGHNPIIQILINHGANINHQDKDGKTALDYAIEGNHTQTKELLEFYGGLTKSSISVQ